MDLDNCSESVQTSDFSPATVLSHQESNSHARVLSGLAWRCELRIMVVGLYTVAISDYNLALILFFCHFIALAHAT